MEIYINIGENKAGLVTFAKSHEQSSLKKENKKG